MVRNGETAVIPGQDLWIRNKGSNGIKWNLTVILTCLGQSGYIDCKKKGFYWVLYNKLVFFYNKRLKWNIFYIVKD